MPTKYRKSKARKPAQLLAYERQERINRAKVLDRIADCELQQGHHLRAEYLAQQAFALRQDGCA
jgi:hypothetical protein